MSDNNRIHFVRYGSHSSASDWTSTPGSLKFARMTSSAPIAGAGSYNYIDRSGYQTGNGEMLPSLQGNKNTQMPDMQFEMHGLSASGAGDTVDASTLDFLYDGMVDHVFGVGGQNGTGMTTHASDAGTGTSVIADATATVVAGDFIMVQGTTSGKLSIRQVTALSTTNTSNDTMTICRALTDDDGSADTADESTTIYAARSWFAQPATSERTHLYFDVEGENIRRQYTGVYANATFDFPGGDSAKINLTGVNGTNWVDDAEANPTYSAPTTGSPIIVNDSPLWVGSTLYMAYDMSLDLGANFVERRSEGGPNGHWGGVCTMFKPMLSGKIRFGTLTAPSEVTDATMQTWQGDAVEDILVQFGRSGGAAMGFRMPAARIEGNIVDDNGFAVLQFTAMATDYSATDAFGNIRLGVF